MKGNIGVKCALGLAIALLAVGAQAQGGGASPATAAAVSAASMSGVSGATATHSATRAANRKLRKAVLLRLSRTKGLDVDRIVVVAKDGAISLEGYVPENSQIDLATSAARAVPGVTDVTNRLIVREEGL
jgi:hyperosmotically inducible periplasmic protein